MWVYNFSLIQENQLNKKKYFIDSVRQILVVMEV